MKRRIMLNRLNALGIGLSAVCLALACGSEEAPPPDNTGEELPPETECDVNPYLEDCPGNEPSVETPPSASGGSGGEPPPQQQPRPPSQEDLALAQVTNILLTNCGGCHGSQLNDRTARAGMNYIDDMEELVAKGKVIPLDAEGSPIIRFMRNGSMPPPNEGGVAVPQAEIDIVANYINNEDNWPDVPKVTCAENPPLSFDELYQDVARDLRGQEVEDRPFMRYVSLDNRTAAGICSNTSLDPDRHALTKMINMLSIRAAITEPEVLNQEQTLFRIDLRELDWDREVVVEGEAFPDVWEAIIAANPYAVPFEGQDADDARDDALTAVPVMLLDSMLDTAMIGNLYYSIIGVDVNESIDDFLANELGIDVLENLENEELIRAGTTKSRISRQDRVIEGHRIEDRPGVYYQSFDFQDDQNESIFENPFGFSEGGREAIFTLPNGMLAFLIADENGALVQDSDILLDISQNNFRALTAVSCANCHVSGFIPVADEVRDIVRVNARTLLEEGTLSQEQLEQLDAVYLEPEAFKRRLEDDSNAFYLNALRQANLPISGPEPVSSVFFRFDRDMDLRVAAGDLGVSADELRNELNSLDPALGVLARGTIDRDDFTAQYLESLCFLSVVNDNRPEQAVCDAALED